MTFLKIELVYWLWCRWRGHNLFSTTWHVLEKPSRFDLSVRVCSGCDRMYPQDMDRAYGILQSDLEDSE